MSFKGRRKFYGYIDIIKAMYNTYSWVWDVVVVVIVEDVLSLKSSHQNSYLSPCSSLESWMSYETYPRWDS